MTARSLDATNVNSIMPTEDRHDEEERSNLGRGKLNTISSAAEVESQVKNSQRSTKLKRALSERHVNMMTFSTIIGIGLFLQAGKVLFTAGPGLSILAYLIMGAVFWAVNGSLGEMAALFPDVKGAVFEFPARFLDEGIGFAAGWMSWFSWVVIVAAEVATVAQLFDFHFDSDYLTKTLLYPKGTQLQWTSTLPKNINPAVFVTVFLVTTLVINLLPVRWYGEIEYAIGVCKMCFIVLLIMFNVINNAHKRTGFTYYESPWGFESKNHTTIGGDVRTGGSSHLANMWTAMTVISFSMIGFEAVSITAPENRDLHRTESIKLATRKIALRIILLYTLASFTAGLNVPYNDQNLRDPAINSIMAGANSVFIVAAVRDHVIGISHFFNGFFILSAASAGFNSLYISSRLLHALAVIPEVWPHWSWVKPIRRQLAYTYNGVPMASVFTSWLFGFLGFLSVKRSPQVALGRLATNSTASMMIVYIFICGAYLQFYQCVNRAKKGQYEENDGRLSHDEDLTKFDREDTVGYPYKSHYQWLRAFLGMISCALITIFNGWQVFYPFSGNDFVASYISILIFFLLVVFYHAKTQGFNPRRWYFKCSQSLREPMRVERGDIGTRRGKLRRPVTRSSIRTFIWEWLK